MNINQIRKLINTKQDILYFDEVPSINSVIEGQAFLAMDKGKTLSLYQKRKGFLWKTNLSKDGNQVVDKDLTVNANLNVVKDISGKNINLEGSIVLGVASTVSTATHQDAYDVRGISIIPVDTSSNTVTFGGFANGVNGQVIHIVMIATGNDIVLEHNESSGTQKMRLAESSDANWGDSGGWSLFCDGTNWFQLSPNFN